MSLQTIIQIGHKIRNELSKEESLQYHRFVKKHLNTVQNNH